MPRIDESDLFGNTDPLMSGNRYRAEMPQGCRLKELRYHIEDSWFTSLQLVVIDSLGAKVELPVVGAPYRRDNVGAGWSDSVTLDDDEHVQAVSGEAHVKSIGLGGGKSVVYQRISSLSLNTNKRVLTFGFEQTQDHVFSFTIPGAGRFAGFLGTLATPPDDNGGRFINSIGILSRPLAPNPLTLAVSGLFQDRALLKPENLLKRGDEAYLKVTVKNAHDFLNARDVILGLDYEAAGFNSDGLTVEVPPAGDHGQLRVGDVPAGGSVDVPIRVFTSNKATIQDNKVVARLLQYSFTLDQFDVAAPNPEPATIVVSSRKA